jgi:hypothetical protein
MELRGGLIRVVTTFEALGEPAPVAVSSAAFEQLWSLLEQRSVATGSPRPAAALLCTQAAFEAWVTGDDKYAALECAAQSGAAYWRIARET